jgi:dipeptidyl aminopeptidase/acylaminoacyl peptidase
MRLFTLACLIGSVLVGCVSSDRESLPDLPCHPPSYYAAPAGAPYVAEEIRVPTEEGYVLAGTLTRPTGGSAPHPAVVLITGSSPQIRDMVGDVREPFVRYQPFRQIADSLTRRGIAVARLDDRGTGCSSGGPIREATTPERATDTVAALTYLKTRHDIDGRRLGIIGISEGADIAILIAASDPSLRAVVAMAGTGDLGMTVSEHQNRYKISIGELWPEEREKFPADTDPELILAHRMAYISRQGAAGEFGRWWRFYLSYDPIPVARQVSSPVLILHGDRDTQVPVAHAERLAEAMRAGGNEDVTVAILADHNHLFLEDADGGYRRYVELLRRTNQLSDEFLDLLGEWVSDRLESAGPYR